MALCEISNGVLFGNSIKISVTEWNLLFTWITKNHTDQRKIKLLQFKFPAYVEKSGFHWIKKVYQARVNKLELESIKTQLN